MPTVAAPSRIHHIEDLLVLHADELAFLWSQRRAAIHDARYTLARFAELNERIEAHAQGLLTVPSALPGLLGKRLLAASDRDETFAAAHALLRLAHPGITARIVEQFSMLPGPQLDGLRDALSSTAIGTAAPAIQALMITGEPARAVAAATVLAHHAQLHAEEPRLSALALDDDPAVATQAWRVIALIDGRLAAEHEAPPPRPYKAALQRPEAPLRNAALAAAVWSAQPWVQRGARLLAEQGDLAAIGWLAAIAVPNDVPLVHHAIESVESPLERLPLWARWGHATAFEPLLEAMNHDNDRAEMAAAGDAFTRITGLDVHGARVVLPVAADADEFEREFAPSVWLPDRPRAQAFVDQQRAAYQPRERSNRGHDLSGIPAPAVMSAIDLPARWDACARAALAGRPLSPPPPASF